MTKSGISIRSIIASVILILVIIGMAVSYYLFKPQGVEGTKNISVKVVHKDGTEKDYEITTQEQFLRGALDSIKLIDGRESDYGLFLTVVDNEEADSNNKEWWCVKKDGQMISFSLESQPILDGEKYELIFVTGFDNY